MPSCTASLSLIWMVSHQRRGGKSSRRQTLLILFKDLRSRNDLQLHADQPVFSVPEALSLPLYRWLAREGRALGHAVWTRFRKCPCFLFPTRRLCRCPIP